MAERRGSPRIELSVACRLQRHSGSPIDARTLELGTGGMSVQSPRPLTTDEVLHFDLPLSVGEVIDGRARVLRQQSGNVYVLRFEGLVEPVRERLAGVTS